MKKAAVLRVASASVCYFILGFFVLLVLFILISAAAGLKLFSVVSPSMQPAIPVGAVIAVNGKNISAIKEGDIITYTAENGAYVTHRVIYSDLETDTVITRGDTNNAADGAITYGAVVGKAVFAVPNLGRLFSFAKHPAGLIFLTLLPITAVLVNSFVRRLLAKKTYIRKTEKTNENAV